MTKQHDIITVAITIGMRKTLEILGISDDKTFIGFRTINIIHFTSSPACHYFEERSANRGSIVKLATILLLIFLENHPIQVITVM